MVKRPQNDSNAASKYEDDEDGLPREIVGAWVREKHARLQRYIDISRSVRKKWVKGGSSGCTFIDLYCGPGRARIRDTPDVLPGSPLAAWSESVKGGSPFTEIHIADMAPNLVSAATNRLKAIGAPAQFECGPAIETVDKIIAKLNPHGLHLALLDPFNLNDLPFEIIRKLAALKHVDILIHLSSQDLNRNLDSYIKVSNSPLDVFAPGWRKKVDLNRKLPRQEDS
jgi:three-Cys-motif partner protein